ncbi:MAG: NAD-dependent epimerase/dehydratase family protein [Bacteroidota bacterium]
MNKVVVTGITGFLGSHIAIQLLKKGYKVLGTLREISRASEIKNIIGKHTDKVANIGFIEANLMDGLEKWVEVTKDQDYIINVASPFPSVMPKNDMELVEPAKKGILTILEAATINRVKKVVHTSSTGAAVYGERKKGTFTEKDWTNEHNKKDTTAYFRSKTIAEKAAWAFLERTQDAPKFTTILPGLILGPVLERDFGNSANLVKKFLDGSVPAIPQVGYELIDVRSVADLHLKAMESEKANGQRFVATNGYVKLKEVAGHLKMAYPDKKIPKMLLPDFLVRIFSLIDKETQPLLTELNSERKVDATKAKTLLDWNPISNEKAILDCAETLYKHNIL